MRIGSSRPRFSLPSEFLHLRQLGHLDIQCPLEVVVLRLDLAPVVDLRYIRVQ